MRPYICSPRYRTAIASSTLALLAYVLTWHRRSGTQADRHPRRNCTGVCLYPPSPTPRRAALLSELAKNKKKERAEKYDSVDRSRASLPASFRRDQKHFFFPKSTKHGIAKKEITINGRGTLTFWAHSAPQPSLSTPSPTRFLTSISNLPPGISSVNTCRDARRPKAGQSAGAGHIHTHTQFLS